MSETPTAAEMRSLWNFGQPAISETRFEEFIQQVVDPAIKAETLTQIARAQGLQRRFEDARATLQLAKSMLPVEGGTAEVAYWLELGRVENSSGNKPAAKPHFLRALELGEAGGHEFLTIDAAHMLGIIEEGESALDWNIKAIALAEASKDTLARNWLGSLLNNTGWSLFALGRHDEALELFQKALAFRIEEGDLEKIRIARYCVAKGLRVTGHVEQALADQQTLATELLAQGEEPGFQWEEIGECLLALQRGEEAATYFGLAYPVLSQNAWLANYETERLERLKQLGSAGGSGG